MKQHSIKQVIALLSILVIMPTVTQAQTFRPNINVDSLFAASIAWMNPIKKAEYQKLYKESDERNKDFLVFMLSMPVSSKKAMIRNIDTNYAQIEALKDAYRRIVPAGYVVRFEYKTASQITYEREGIDMRITRTDKLGRTVDQEWNMSLTSDTLHRMLKDLHWTMATVDSIRQWLTAAHCIGIENGDIPTIEFARSGMGLFSIKLFDKPLTEKQIPAYNDGCQYIFYKDNIVLEYGGGAVGPQCFSSLDPDL